MKVLRLKIDIEVPLPEDVFVAANTISIWQDKVEGLRTLATADLGSLDCRREMVTPRRRETKPDEPPPLLTYIENAPGTGNGSGGEGRNAPPSAIESPPEGPQIGVGWSDPTEGQTTEGSTGDDPDFAEVEPPPPTQEETLAEVGRQVSAAAESADDPLDIPQFLRRQQNEPSDTPKMEV